MMITLRNTRKLISAAALAALGAAAVASPATRADVRSESDAYFAQNDALMVQRESYGGAPETIAPALHISLNRGRWFEYNGTTIDNDVARGEAYGDVALAESSAGAVAEPAEEALLLVIMSDDETVTLQPGQSILLVTPSE